MNSLIIACATDDQETFIPDHFGEAKYFMLYRLMPEGWEHVKILENNAREGEAHGHHHHGQGHGHGHGHGHGEGAKAQAILEHFREEQVDVFVSRRFGPNIVRINKYVLPVIVREAVTLEEGLEACRRRYQELAERLSLPVEVRKHLVI
jgi:predicted Fe-Mo cluster-binding NifX family protein